MTPGTPLPARAVTKPRLGVGVTTAALVALASGGTYLLVSHGASQLQPPSVKSLPQEQFRTPSPAPVVVDRAPGSLVGAAPHHATREIAVVRPVAQEAVPAQAVLSGSPTGAPAPATVPSPSPTAGPVPPSSAPPPTTSTTPSPGTPPPSTAPTSSPTSSPGDQDGDEHGERPGHDRHDNGRHLGQLRRGV